jgi:hypothetical protein
MAVGKRQGEGGVNGNPPPCHGKKLYRTYVEAERAEAVVAWEPRSHPQAAFIACPVFEIFFGGARGSLKTDSALGDWISHEDLYGEHAIGLMVRRTRTQLAETYERAKADFHAARLQVQRFGAYLHRPDGGRLRFAYLERDRTRRTIRATRYTRVYVEELGNFPNQAPVMKLMATLRSAARRAMRLSRDRQSRRARAMAG